MNNILLIDDNKGDTLLFKEELERYHPEVSLEIAMDEETALSCLNDTKSSFDLVVLDIHLPGKDGFDILEEIRRMPKYRKLPVVIFTSAYSEDEKKKALQLGAEFMCEKPFELEDYHQVIEQMIKIGNHKPNA